MIDWLIDWCSLLCKRSWTLTEKRNSTAPAKQGHLGSQLNEGRNEGGNEQDEQTTDRKTERAQNEWLIDWLVGLLLVGRTDGWIASSTADWLLVCHVRKELQEEINRSFKTTHQHQSVSVNKWRASDGYMYLTYVWVIRLISGHS